MYDLQLAKLAGNRVVATCGGEQKAKLLKELGVDRVIDYKVEDIKTVNLLHPFNYFSCILRIRKLEVELDVAYIV